MEFILFVLGLSQFTPAGRRSRLPADFLSKIGGLEIALREFVKRDA